MSLNKWKQPQYELHRVELKRRGVTKAQAAARGYEPLTAEESRREIGQDVGPTIALPCLALNGEPKAHRRFRLLDPKKIAERNGQRYTQRAGTGALIHVRKPNQRAPDFRKVRVITEGEIKADAIAEHIGVTAISLPGVDCFRQEGKLHPDLAALNWNGYTAEFAYDTDQDTKPQVRRAMLAAADELAAVGAKVRFRDLPSIPNATKAGADDVIQNLGAAAYIKAPLHALDSAVVKSWRATLAKAPQLPAALRDLQPVSRDWFDRKPPPAEYVVEPIWQTGESCLLAGQASVGKSYFALPMHAAIGTGTPFFGFPVPEPRKSLYIMCERHEKSLRRRWYKITRAMAGRLLPGPRSRFEKLLHENCFLKAVAGETFSLIELVRDQWRPSAVVDELIAELRSAGITVLFFDPLSRLHGGNENDASVAAAITKALERIVQQAGCSVLIVHHTGKSDRGDMYAGRGSSVFNDNTSETFTLGIVDAEERKKLDLSTLAPQEAAYDIVRWRHARCSDGRPADDMYFLRDGQTGLLRAANLSRKSADATLRDAMGPIRAWASRDAPADGFSKNQFVSAHDEFDLTKRRAESMFADAIASQDFVKFGEKKGFPLYRVAPERHSETMLPRLPVNIRASGNHKKPVNSVSAKNA